MALPPYPQAAFTYGYPAPGGYVANASASRSSSIMSGVFGTNTSDSVAYNIASVTIGQEISSADLLDLANKAVEEKVRRGGQNILIPANYYEDKIIASRVQDIRTQLEIKGPAAKQYYNGDRQGANSSNGLIITGYTTGQVLVGYDGYYGGAVYAPGAVATYGQLADPQVVTYPQAAAPTMDYRFVKNDRITAANINKLIKEINDAGATCLCNCNYCTCNCNYCTCNCNYACTCNCNYSDERVKTNVEYL